ncbi:XRE family transcriptional regulator [Chakrabartyella piscis]|uniref:LexA family protein n=1 Tax=Chakrabartyella piscis TaxID=2918914 RepID=UPI0029587F17|nr:XRE family transcriptional regulator [Chakrabartyella piscis]
MDTMDRIEELVKDNQMNQADLARATGARSSSVSDWFKRKSTSYNKYLSEIADCFGVTTDYLLGNVSEPFFRLDNEAILADINSYEDVPVKKSTRIPVLGRVAAGIPLEAIEEIVDWEEIPEEMSRGGEYFGLVIAGDSMEPRICKGDVVIVRKQSDVESGEIAIVIVNGNEGTCKKVIKHDDGISLVSLNPTYDPKFYTWKEIESTPISINGKVVELRGKF